MKQLLLPLALLISSIMLSQRLNDDGERGYFSVQNYSHEEYQAFFQNWFIAQDKNDFIYAGNGDGVLEFDGVSWRLITSPGLRAIRSIVVDDNNVKWIGADSELGYLEPDSLGLLQYTSLKDKIPTSNPLNKNVWEVFVTEKGVLFITDDTIYRWKDDHFKIIPTTGYLNKEFQVNGEIYVRIKDRGLFVLEDDRLRLAPSGEMFKNLRVDILLPYENHKLLFASRDDGVFIYDGESVIKQKNEVDSYLKENILYTGLKIPGERYAFVTLRGGVVIMDKKGALINTITTVDQILNNQVHEIALDNQNGLWLALQTGISQIEPYLPYSFFDERSGLEGTTSAILRHGESLFVGTYSGLYQLEKRSISSLPKFKRIEDIKRGCLGLISVDEGLLASTLDGTFLISGNETVKIDSSIGARTLYRSKIDVNRIFIGHLNGLSSIYLKNNKWQSEDIEYQVDDHIVSITENQKGHLWLKSATQNIIQLEFLAHHHETGKFDAVKIRNVFGKDTGFPNGFTHMFLIDKDLYANSDRNDGPLFKFDTVAKSFEPYSNFNEQFGLDTLYVYPLAIQNSGNHFFLESRPIDGKQYRFSAFKNTEGGYSTKRLFDERFRSTTENTLFWDDENTVWLGGEVVTKYELNKKFNFETSFSNHVRKVIIGQDSIIYGGRRSFDFKPKLTYGNAGLRFEYAAPYLMAPKETQYQYRLAGFDQKWSSWTKETKKDYTNLPEGEYQFQSRAQNIFGTVSTIGTFEFEILPPLYRTWGAYLLYLFLFLGFLWAILKLRSRQLKSQNEALEKLIAVRTSEVQHQANQLKIQSEQLQELDKAKSRFFANISHEFRTPLTLIKGPIEQLEQNFTEKLSMDTVKMIRRNANRLLNMVNQLLDLSKIDEGNLKIAPTEGDVYKCLRTAASSFNSHAAQRNMDYRVEIPSTILWASFDRDKLENIIYNLLGNAFKFSRDGVQITFVAEYTEYGLQIRVSDAGKGIPQEKLPFIFDRFYQADSSNTRDSGGSGIGLSLSKNLVELMDGTITVMSEVEKGTQFIVQLPIQEIKTRQNKIIEPTPSSKKIGVPKPFVFSPKDQRNLPTILLVEDNSDMRHFIKEQLIGFYKVEEAFDGSTGLKKAVSNPPDLIITDLMMPKMDGIELCKELKTDINTSHIPVIMLTAKAGMNNKLEGLETGADDYLTKPFNSKELLVRTKNLIQQRQNLRELFSNKEVRIDPKKVTVNSIDEKFLEQVLALLEANYPNSDFGVPQMQNNLAMSKTQLHRKLKALTNEAPGELLRNFRLKRAAQLLSQKADSVTQIAYRVGFNNLSYFAKCFKELYGVAPSAY